MIRLCVLLSNTNLCLRYEVFMRLPHRWQDLRVIPHHTLPDIHSQLVLVIADDDLSLRFDIYLTLCVIHSNARILSWCRRLIF